MKILILSEYFPSGKDLKFSGGVEARNYFMAKNLSKKHNVTIIASLIRGQKEKEKTEGVNIIRVGKRRKYNATTGSIIDRSIFVKEAIITGRALDINIVEGTNFLTHFIAKRISKTKKIPVVAWYPDVWLGNWVKNAGIYGLIGEFLERFNLNQKYDAYIAISKQTSEKLAKYVKKRIYIINCGIEKEEYIKKTKKLNRQTIICVSRLTKYKNIKTLIFAFADLSSRLKNLSLAIVGSGPEFNNLTNLSRQLKLSKNIKFYASLPRSDLMDMYATSHVFSLPSKVEGFGIATIEAASFGLPYVNANIPVQKEITKNGQGGFLVNPESPLEYSQKLYKLLTDKKLYLKKSLEARNLAKSYDWQKISQETEKVYKSLL
jgi:glycosyltransferase involved in cell wall biosynthesis